MVHKYERVLFFSSCQFTLNSEKSAFRFVHKRQQINMFPKTLNYSFNPHINSHPFQCFQTEKLGVLLACLSCLTLECVLVATMVLVLSSLWWGNSGDISGIKPWYHRNLIDKTPSARVFVSFIYSFCLLFMYVWHCGVTPLQCQPTHMILPCGAPLLLLSLLQ